MIVRLPSPFIVQLNVTSSPRLTVGLLGDNVMLGGPTEYRAEEMQLNQQM